MRFVPVVVLAACSTAPVEIPVPRRICPADGGPAREEQARRWAVEQIAKARGG